MAIAIAAADENNEFTCPQCNFSHWEFVAKEIVSPLGTYENMQYEELKAEWRRNASFGVGLVPVMLIIIFAYAIFVGF